MRGKLCEVSGAMELPEITTGLYEVGETFTQPPLLGELTITITKVKTLKHWRCKSRKRFMKLLMGEGLGRNAARVMADHYGRFSTFQRTWRQYLMNSNMFSLLE